MRMILNFTAELLRMYIDMRLLLDGKFEKPKYYRTHICSPGVKTDPLCRVQNDLTSDPGATVQPRSEVACRVSSNNPKRNDFRSEL